MAIKDYLAGLTRKNSVERLRQRIRVTDLSAEHVNEALDKFGAEMINDPSLAKDYYAMVKDELVSRLKDERSKRRR